MEDKKEKVKITLQLEPDVYKRLEQERKKKGITITELINIILYDSYFVN